MALVMSESGWVSINLEYESQPNFCVRKNIRTLVLGFEAASTPEHHGKSSLGLILPLRSYYQIEHPQVKRPDKYAHGYSNGAHNLVLPHFHQVEYLQE